MLVSMFLLNVLFSYVFYVLFMFFRVLHGCSCFHALSFGVKAEWVTCWGHRSLLFLKGIWLSSPEYQGDVTRSRQPS